jgi:3D-(3,5/4)-trihydroxycyclohexane-1,2-dione acylhydrolase (decyclizing)
MDSRTRTGRAVSERRLTVAQALVRAMAAQWTEFEGTRCRVFAGVWAIFGHGNVAGLGEALYGARELLPTLRAHNEQAMGHAAVAFAKASFRRRMMACTTSIGPGATNLTTAAAVAHVNRLPLLLLPGDVFATRRPDPVLQQVEDFADGLTTANDCLRPVSRYFDRITRPEQLVSAFERALQVLTDPALCGPVTLALCQDVQTEAISWPARFFEERLWTPRRPPPAREELARAVQALRAARKPLLVCGGGVLYAEASAALARFCERHATPCAETQAGKSALAASHPLNLGGLGVTGTAAANALAADADVIVAIGTRLQDFTTGSASLFASGARIVALNVQPLDAGKHGALPLVADAGEGLRSLSEALGDWRAGEAWSARAADERRAWLEAARSVSAAPARGLPSDAQVIGAVQRSARAEDIVVCAAGGLPGELHRHWRAEVPGGYHLEYGYSCMGYEIAGALGVKLARPEREVIALLGDGSYLMLNSEIATAVETGRKLILVVLDNRGFACIERLQHATGNASFNNLRPEAAPHPDFAAHARSLGAEARKVRDLAELESALAAARAARTTSVLVIETDPAASTAAGGHWWDVPVAEVSERAEVRQAAADYAAARARRDGGG